MSQTPLVPPPSEGGSGSGSPGEEGLPISALTGTGPQNAVAPGTDPDQSAPNADGTVVAPAGDPGASASDLGAASDAGSLSGDDVSNGTGASDPMPDMI